MDDLPNIEREQAEEFILHTDRNVFLTGRAGTGKTTLLHLLGGLMPLQEGHVTIGKHDLGTVKGKHLDDFRGKNIGIVFQKPHFISSISIMANLLLTQKLGGGNRSKEDIMNLLKKLEIDHRVHAKPNSLSQGELQRASVARAILNKPQVILADEPTSALDDVSCEQVFNLLQESAKDLNAALLIVTHDGRLKSIVDNKILLS